MAQKELSIAIEDQVDFFLPIFQSYTEGMTKAFSQSREEDYTDAEWMIILNKGQFGQLLKRHFLLSSWADLEKFLQKKAKMFCFIEKKMKGLVGNEFKFWVFFSPTTAGEFFKHQVEKPKDFSMNSILPLPPPHLLEPMTEKITNILSNEKLSVFEYFEKTVELLKLADWYLPSDEIEQLDISLKKMIVNLMINETKSLQHDVNSPGISAGILKKRLRNFFKLGWRYFRAKNELETNYFKKLLSENNDDRLKGLRLAQKKVEDFRAGQI